MPRPDLSDMQRVASRRCGRRTANRPRAAKMLQRRALDVTATRARERARGRRDGAEGRNGNGSFYGDNGAGRSQIQRLGKRRNRKVGGRWRRFQRQSAGARLATETLTPCRDSSSLDPGRADGDGVRDMRRRSSCSAPSTSIAIGRVAWGWGGEHLFDKRVRRTHGDCRPRRALGVSAPIT